MNKTECLKAIILLSMRGYAYPEVKKDKGKYYFTMEKAQRVMSFYNGEDVDKAIQLTFVTPAEYDAWAERKGVLL